MIAVSYTHTPSQGTIGRTNDYSNQKRNSGTRALLNCVTNECEIDNETDDFETNPDFEKEGRAVGGKRSFSNTQGNFPETKAESTLKLECCERWCNYWQIKSQKYLLVPRNCSCRHVSPLCQLIGSNIIGTDSVLSW